jgi:hypothetical protein
MMSLAPCFVRWSKDGGVSIWVPGSDCDGRILKFEVAGFAIMRGATGTGSI